MKILVHVGAAKVGSTSIQHYLGRSRLRLAARGVMVQHIDGTPPDHIAMGRALVTAEPAPPDAMVLDRILRDAKAAAPEWLVLSSEAIWAQPEGAEILRQRLAPLSGDLTLVAYLREPVALYRSHLQQQVRFAPRIASPLEWQPRYRETVTAWKAAFGDRLVLAPFQPSSFHRSHLGADFLHRGGLTVIDADIDDDIRKNPSECAEVSSILQDYHLANYPRGYRVLRRDASGLRHSLNRLAARLNTGNPVVLAETIPSTILARTRDELWWLESVCGLRFDAVPYDLLGQMEVDGGWAGVTRFDQICTVDPGVKTALQMALLQELLLRERMEGPARNSGPVDKGPQPSAGGPGSIRQFAHRLKRRLVHLLSAKKNHPGT